MSDELKTSQVEENSHDIANLLTVILGNVKLLLHRIEKPEPLDDRDELLKRIQPIERAAQKIATLMRS